MPELQEPKQPPYVDLEQADYAFGSDSIADEEALSLVTASFAKAESYRLNNQEKRWQEAEALYFGIVKKRKWKGTDVDRAALGIPITLDQVESAYPIITSNLFSQAPYWFDVIPKRGMTIQDALTTKQVISSYLDTPLDDAGLTAVRHFKKAIRQALILGDGVVEVGWDAGLEAPYVEHVDLKDIYIEPSTRDNLIDASPYVIRRKLVSVEKLNSMRNQEGVRIPSLPELNALAKQKVSSNEQAKQVTDLFRNEMTPDGLVPNPASQYVEVLMYWDKSRLVWILGRKWTAINMENPYGFIPYCKTHYIEVIGKQYSISIPDIVGDEQKLIQGLTSLRLDNVNLALAPPRIEGEGISNRPSDTQWMPGGVIKRKPTDIEITKVENITPDAYNEVAQAEQRASKRTGINQFAQMGVPTPSNANRSATGVQAQAGAINQRLQPVVENIEDYLIVPALYKIFKLIRMFAPEEIQFEGEQGQAMSVPRSTFDKDIKIKMSGASKMVSRERLAVFIQPLSQMLFNPAVLQEAAKQNQTINFGEFYRFLQDATQTSDLYSFFRPMSQQEQQAAQQPDSRTRAQMMMAQMNAQTRTQMGQMKVQGELQKAQLQAGIHSNETGEKSAREILRVFAQQQAKGRENKRK